MEMYFIVESLTGTDQFGEIWEKVNECTLEKDARNFVDTFKGICRITQVIPPKPYPIKIVIYETPR